MVLFKCLIGASLIHLYLCLKVGYEVNELLTEEVAINDLSLLIIRGEGLYRQLKYLTIIIVCNLLMYGLFMLEL